MERAPLEAAAPKVADSGALGAVADTRALGAGALETAREILIVSGTGTGREALQETDWEGAETCFSLLSQADFKKEELAKDKKKGKKKWSKQDWIDPELKIMGGGCGH